MKVILKKITVETLYTGVLSVLCLMTMNIAKAQTYDPYDVQVINNLIRNNGLPETPDAPESWTAFYNPETGELGGFIEWNDEMPKKIVYLNVDKRELTGAVSLVGLKNLETLGCSFNNSLTELNLTNCSQLRGLFCDHNSFLTKLIITNCTRLSDMYVPYNCLTELDLTGINPGNFRGSMQRVPLTLYKNETGEYSCAISLNNPTFRNSAISYSDGILKSKDNTVDSTFFEVQTNTKYRRLSGDMIFTYSDDTGIPPIDNPLLKIYPNPVNDTLFVEYKESQPITVKIYDMLGGEVLVHNAIGKTAISISHLEKGNYIVNVFSEGKIIGNAKIVK